MRFFYVNDIFLLVLLTSLLSVSVLNVPKLGSQESNIEKVKSGRWLLVYEKSNERFIASIMKKIMTLYFDLCGF